MLTGMFAIVKSPLDKLSQCYEMLRPKCNVAAIIKTTTSCSQPLQIELRGETHCWFKGAVYYMLNYLMCSL